MYHYVIMKVKKGVDAAGTAVMQEKASAELLKTQQGLLSCKISVNCVERETSFDIVNRMEFEDEAALCAFLNSNRHKESANSLDSPVETVCIFDSKELI